MPIFYVEYSTVYTYYIYIYTCVYASQCGFDLLARSWTPDPAESEAQAQIDLDPKKKSNGYLLLIDDILVAG